MQLHEFRTNRRKKNVQRIGRSGKRGSYSGRGVKGQKSRAGRRIRPAERDLIIRLPKRRGFTNKPKAKKAAVFNLKQLSAKLELAARRGSPLTLDRDFLKVMNFLPPHYGGNVKVLGDGEIKTPVQVKGLKVSKNAKRKIEKAGGKVN